MSDARHGAAVVANKAARAEVAMEAGCCREKHGLEDWCGVCCGDCEITSLVYVFKVNYLL